MLLKAESKFTRLPEKLSGGIQALYESFNYSQDTGSDLWEFAISFDHLKQLGFTERDLRWLVLKGYVQHAGEVTIPGDDGRSFRPTGNLTFCERTCVVLTEDGASRASANDLTRADADALRCDPPTDVPVWDPQSRHLSFNGLLVKWFKWRAANQEVVLSAFEEDGWPARIDDPLPPHPDQDSKRRLSDTIKCLNRKQCNEAIKFHGDGTGEGIVWKIEPH